MAKEKFYPLHRMTKLMEIRQLSDDSFTDADFMTMVWEIESCDEAIELFGDEMLQCPVCFAVIQDGVIVHKQKDEILN